MPELLILRHAKSDWSEGGLRDFDRPLNERGRKAAAKMGQVIAKIGEVDAVLASPAKRVVETIDHLGIELPEPEYDNSLYGASPTTILGLATLTPHEAKRLLLVGHNPGMGHLAVGLAGGADSQQAHEMREKYPTAALARFEFDGDWSDLKPQHCRFMDFVKPRDL